MKAHREHRVPLSRRATQILLTALAVRNGSKLVFPSPHGKPLLSDITLPTLLKQQGVAAVTVTRRAAGARAARARRIIAGNRLAWS